ncbi:COG3904 family protein [Pseudomonas solani]|uniref:ATP-dependent Clp protease proteolytic subunit n=1 Tax=Pseudomonas solani TaxID=2731552 RepID=UPI003D6B0279
MHPRRLAPLFAALAFASSTALADVTKDASCQTAAGCYTIAGTITNEDAAAVARIAASLKDQGVVGPKFLLNSGGGSLFAGIEIGKSLRQMRALAMVTLNSQCASACVFILAGASRRATYGAVGIHRPYTEQVGNIDIAQAQVEYRDTQAKARAYLQDMNLSDDLYEAMVRIPSEQIQVLTPEELARFGLDKNDPVEQEFLDAGGAELYGLSKSEYLRRKGIASTECGKYLTKEETAQQYLDCRDAILSNTSTYPAKSPPTGGEDLALKIALQVAYDLYPFLDHTKPGANRAAIDEVVQVRDSLMARGYSPAQAIQAAVEQIGPKYAE